MKSSAHLEQARKAPLHLDAARRWASYAAENLEERALPSSIATNYADDVACVHIERDVAKRIQSALAIFVIEPVERPQATKVAQGCGERRRKTHRQVLRPVALEIDTI